MATGYAIGAAEQRGWIELVEPDRVFVEAGKGIPSIPVVPV